MLDMPHISLWLFQSSLAVKVIAEGFGYLTRSLKVAENQTLLGGKKQKHTQDVP